MTTIQPLHILLAEDNQDHADLVIETLQEYNVANHIDHVKAGDDVFRFLDRIAPFDALPDKGLPDIILLDIKMPRMNGREVLAKLKQETRWKKIPVIMVTTSANPTEINECFALGASSYLTKPIKFNEFAQKIRDLNFYWVMITELPKYL